MKKPVFLFILISFALFSSKILSMDQDFDSNQRTIKLKKTVSGSDLAFIGEIPTLQELRNDNPHLWESLGLDSIKAEVLRNQINGTSSNEQDTYLHILNTPLNQITLSPEKSSLAYVAKLFDMTLNALPKCTLKKHSVDLNRLSPHYEAAHNIMQTLHGITAINHTPVTSAVRNNQPTFSSLTSFIGHYILKNLWFGDIMTSATDSNKLRPLANPIPVRWYLFVETNAFLWRNHPHLCSDQFKSQLRLFSHLKITHSHSTSIKSYHCYAKKKLSHYDFTNSEIHRFYFSQCSFSHINFKGAHLVDCSFTETSFKECESSERTDIFSSKVVQLPDENSLLFLQQLLSFQHGKESSAQSVHRRAMQLLFTASLYEKAVEEKAYLSYLLKSTDQAYISYFTEHTSECMRYSNEEKWKVAAVLYLAAKYNQHSKQAEQLYALLANKFPHYIRMIENTLCYDLDAVYELLETLRASEICTSG